MDTLFDEHLAQARDQAKRDGLPLRLDVLAHRGLVEVAAQVLGGEKMWGGMKGARREGDRRHAAGDVPRP